MNSSGRRTVYQVLYFLSPPPQVLPALAAAPSGFIPSPLAFGDTGAGPRGQRLQEAGSASFSEVGAVSPTLPVGRES